MAFQFAAGATSTTRMKRAFQTPTSTSVTTSSSSDIPFFPNPSTMVPSPQSSEASHRQALTKSILEWLFFVIALMLITTFLACRSWQLRRRNRPLNQFFSISSPHSTSFTRRPRRISRTTGLPPLNEPLQHISLTHSMLYPPPSPLPAVYRRERHRTTAMDTDAGGRRAGCSEDDHKDVLPAYDSVGGPPKYVELNGNARGTPVHVDLVGVVERDLAIDAPRRSAEDVASSSHSHHSRHSSTHSQVNLRQNEPDDPPTPDPSTTRQLP